MVSQAKNIIQFIVLPLIMVAFDLEIGSLAVDCPLKVLKTDRLPTLRQAVDTLAQEAYTKSIIVKWPSVIYSNVTNAGIPAWIYRIYRFQIMNF